MKLSDGESVVCGSSGNGDAWFPLAEAHGVQGNLIPYYNFSHVDEKAVLGNRKINDFLIRFTYSWHRVSSVTEIIKFQKCETNQLQNAESIVLMAMLINLARELIHCFVSL